MSSNSKRLKKLHLVTLCITVTLMITQLILSIMRNPLADGVVVYSVIIILSIALIIIAVKRKLFKHAKAYAFYAVCCVFCIALYVISKLIQN